MKFRGAIVVWLLIFMAVFCIAYWLTGYVVTRVMADFVVEPEPTYHSTLQVEPNFGTQTDQYTPIQPSVTPQAQ